MAAPMLSRFGRRKSLDDARGWDGSPYDGQIVECRWCPDGYATFKAGEWVFSSYLTDRIERMTSPEATAERAARMRDILGKD